MANGREDKNEGRKTSFYFINEKKINSTKSIEILVFIIQIQSYYYYFHNYLKNKNKINNNTNMHDSIWKKKIIFNHSNEIFVFLYLPTVQITDVKEHSKLAMRIFNTCRFHSSIFLELFVIIPMHTWKIWSYLRTLIMLAIAYMTHEILEKKHLMWIKLLNV